MDTTLTLGGDDALAEACLLRSEDLLGDAFPLDSDDFLDGAGLLGGSLRRIDGDARLTFVEAGAPNVDLSTGLGLGLGLGFDLDLDREGVDLPRLEPD